MNKPAAAVAVTSLLLKKTGVTFTHATFNEKLLSYRDYPSLINVNNVLQELSMQTNNFISFSFIGKRL